MTQSAWVLIFACLGAFLGVLVAAFLAARMIRSIIWSRYPVQTISYGDEITLLSPDGRYPKTFVVTQVNLLYSINEPARMSVDLVGKDELEISRFKTDLEEAMLACGPDAWLPRTDETITEAAHG